MALIATFCKVIASAAVTRINYRTPAAAPHCRCRHAACRMPYVASVSYGVHITSDESHIHS
eukprot:5329622-Pleurochrysis_carterae.AAC.3